MSLSHISLQNGQSTEHHYSWQPVACVKPFTDKNEDDPLKEFYEQAKAERTKELGGVCADAVWNLVTSIEITFSGSMTKLRHGG